MSEQNRFEKREYFVIGYSDFEDLVNRVYGGSDYDFVANEKIVDGIIITYCGIGQAELSVYEIGLMDVYRARPFGKAPIARLLLRDMCNLGIIESGNYLIEVNW